MTTRAAACTALLLVLTGCVAPGANVADTGAPAPAPECRFDSDCPAMGSCHEGACSAIPRICSADHQCGTGSCAGGTCSPVPPALPSPSAATVAFPCTTDLDCGGRTCLGGSCR